ncbi:unnamed protein product [Rangifer tarandus platyrhynchus]|uniref:Uncharacterized protein n=1 Tax=Rangifer tarandus platyrhynchus TaxID=3082113 RepID=A0AC59YZB9_RANTA
MLSLPLPPPPGRTYGTHFAGDIEEPLRARLPPWRPRFPAPRQSPLLSPGRSASSRLEASTPLRAGPARLPQPHAAGRAPPRGLNKAAAAAGGLGECFRASPRVGRRGRDAAGRSAPAGAPGPGPGQPPAAPRALAEPHRSTATNRSREEGGRKGGGPACHVTPRGANVRS